MVHAGTIERGDQDAYTFKKLLGSGTFGEVWSATTTDGTEVAIKVYHSGEKDSIKNVKKELETLRKISANDTICRKYAVCLLDFYYSGDAPRIVMEYVHGEPISKYRRNFNLTERQSRDDMIINLVLGLDALHKQGITHQDLKGDNIMWDAKKKMPRYVDWGLACLKKYCKKRLFCKNPCGTSGTAYTMPPGMEYGAFNEKTFDIAKAHDIWSLGVVLLDWFTMPKNKTTKIYYGGTGGGGLNETAPLYLSEEQLQNRIYSINNPLAKKILPLLLQRKSPARNREWRNVVHQVSEPIPHKPEERKTSQPERRKKLGAESKSFKSVDQCRPAVNLSMDAIITVPRGIPGTFWCFNKADIIADESFDPVSGTFTNVYTGKEQTLTKTDRLQIQNKWQVYHSELGERQLLEMRNKFQSLVLEENNLEKAARNYLVEVLDLPRLFKQCKGTHADATLWDTFLKGVSTENTKYSYILPYFWRLVNFPMEHEDLLAPIQLNEEYIRGVEISWRFTFDSFSPLVTVAAIFRLMETWIDTLMEGIISDPTPNKMSVKRKLLCDYINDFADFSETVNYDEMCKKFLSGWNAVLNDITSDQILEEMGDYIGGSLPPLPLEWYIQTQERIDELDKITHEWVDSPPTDKHC